MPDSESTPLRRILVADDEPHIRRVLQTMLEAAPFEVDAVKDGAEALDRLREDRSYDLVVSDLMMPRMDGLELLSAVRELPARAGLPIVILTAKGQDADGAEAYARGAADFMTKPFSPKKLLARIRELLDQRD